MDLIYVYLVYKPISDVVSNTPDTQEIHDKIENCPLHTKDIHDMVRFDITDVNKVVQLQTQIEDTIYEALANLRIRNMHIKNIVKTQDLKYDLDYTLDLITPELLEDLLKLYWYNHPSKEKRQMLFMLSEYVEPNKPLEVRCYFNPNMVNNTDSINNLLGLVDSMVTEFPMEIDKLQKKRQ